MGQLSSQNEIGTSWLLKPGKYRIYGVMESLLGATTELLTPRSSTTVCIEFEPLLGKVKTEPGLQTIYELSDDSNSKNVEVTTPIPQSIEKTKPIALEIREEVVVPMKSSILSTPVVTPPESGVHCLIKLSVCKRSKSVLSHIEIKCN